MKKYAPLWIVDRRVVQFAPISCWAQSQFQIFSVLLVSRNFDLLVIFTLKEKNSNYIWGSLGVRFMEHVCDVLWNTFSDFAILGILWFQLTSKSPFNWNISILRTINLQLLKDHDGPSGFTQMALFGVSEYLTPDNLLKNFISICF